MAESPRYRRVLIKLSGESFCRAGHSGIERSAVSYTVGEIQSVLAGGVQVAVVIGAGNLMRGRMLADNPDIQRPTADAMGMLATVMNGLALQDSLEAAGVKAQVMSAIPMPSICESYTRRSAIRCLQEGKVVILVGGTGSPFFTTDTGASLRACELDADVMLKATKVDGVFDSDPEKNPAAKKYVKLTYQKVLTDRLGVMDLSAVTMCMEKKIPIMVFQISKPGNLAAAVHGQAVGTLVSEQ